MDNRKEKKHDLPLQPGNGDGKSSYPKSENNPLTRRRRGSKK